MPIAITKSIPANTIPNSQVGNYSPNLNISYWVAGNAQVPNLSSNATLNMQGYFDQAGYDANNMPMARLQIIIPSADAATALASDSALGTYLLTTTQFSGGTAAEAS